MGRRGSTIRRIGAALAGVRPRWFLLLAGPLGPGGGGGDLVRWLLGTLGTLRTDCAMLEGADAAVIVGFSHGEISDIRCFFAPPEGTARARFLFYETRTVDYL